MACCEREDVLGAVDYARSRYAPGAIGVLGASMGGVAALHAAAGDEAIGAVIADSAFADFSEMIERAFHQVSPPAPVVSAGALAFGRALTGVTFGACARWSRCGSWMGDRC